mgnify:FL=1
MFHFIQIIAALPLRMLFPTKIIGKKNIPNGACIISSNHTSNMDAVMLAVKTWEKKYYLAKKELFKNKLFGFILKKCGAVKIDRQANDVTAIKNCLKILKNNKKLVIFPEGTRVHNENMELGEVKHGVAMFAIKAKVPIVPMFITKTPKIFRRNRIYIGEPFTLEEFYGKKLTEEELKSAGEIVTAKMQEIREYALNSLTKKK